MAVQLVGLIESSERNGNYESRRIDGRMDHGSWIIDDHEMSLTEGGLAWVKLENWVGCGYVGRMVT
jgi:hypothetical protein